VRRQRRSMPCQRGRVRTRPGYPFPRRGNAKRPRSGLTTPAAFNAQMGVAMRNEQLRDFEGRPCCQEDAYDPEPILPVGPREEPA
jgi:hypothetical protein